MSTEKVFFLRKERVGRTAGVGSMNVHNVSREPRDHEHGWGVGEGCVLRALTFVGYLGRPPVAMTMCSAESRV